MVTLVCLGFGVGFAGGWVVLSLVGFAGGLCCGYWICLVDFGWFWLGCLR